jgi:hypothetical protein
MPQMGQFWLKSDTLLDDVQEQSRFQDHVCSLASRCKLGKLTCFAHKRPRRPFGFAIAIGREGQVQPKAAETEIPADSPRAMNTDVEELNHGNQVDVFNRQRQH